MSRMYTNQQSQKKTKSDVLTKIEQRKQSENLSDNKYYVQTLIDIEDIVNGYVITKSGSIVKILEILPLNFVEKPDSMKDRIANAFGYGLKQCTKNGHIKIMHSLSDLEPFIRNVRTAMENETNPQLIKRVEDYIQNTIRLQKNHTCKNRFFFIFEYEGDANEKKTNDWTDINLQMKQTTLAVSSAIQNAGNYVIDYGMNNVAIAEIFYAFYNPKSSQTETFQQRQLKVIEASDYLAQHGDAKVSPLADYIAPRGIRFGTWDYVVMDGTYHTYLALKDEAFPQECYAGQITESLTDRLGDCDVDIYYKQQSRETSLYILDRANVISKGVARNFNGDEAKQESLSTTARNAKYIRDCMTENDEELYNVAIILTIRADSLKALNFIRDSYIKTMRTRSFYFDSCFLRTQEFWKMTTPLLYFNQTIFKDNCRNMTNNSFAALYCFTSFEMFDDNGCCLGTTVSQNNNSTLFSINNFDTKRYPNPHIFLIGTTGAGKTFTELMLTSRMRMHGMRTLYILPLKGHEYRDAVLSLGGEFISLRPGGTECLNIMEIRPEAKPNLEGLMEEDVKAELAKMPSLLSKKITSITTWIQILANENRLTVDESGELNALLQELYESFGFSEDNESIWADEQHSALKPMPILSDLYNAFQKNEMLSKRASLLKAWITGNCKNMNAQTNVDLTNRTIAFDINEDYIGEDLLPGFMYIAFDAGYDICKMDIMEKCVIALDEVWKIMQVPACAKQIYKMIRILRGYSAAAITATQDIEECLNNEYGRAILTNSAIKIFLRVTSEELKTITQTVSLSKENQDSLMSAPHGRGFVTYGTERIYIDFMASELEEELYTTDINVKMALREKHKRKN